MKSVKEISTETKILDRLKNQPVGYKLVKFLFNDEELQEWQEYANNVSIRRLGYNDHGPVHMRQVCNNAIKMLNILHEAGIPTSLEKEEIGTFEARRKAISFFRNCVSKNTRPMMPMMAISRATMEAMVMSLPRDCSLWYMFPIHSSRCRTATWSGSREGSKVQTVSLI